MCCVTFTGETTLNIIIYGSHYGTARLYAEELARRINYDLKSFEEINDIDSYENIIYIGALYAGGVLGMKKTFKKLRNTNNKKIIIATVGLSDTTDKGNTTAIRNGIKKQLSAEIYNNAHIIHLRGGIDYSRLNFTHKTMMKLLYKKAVNLPEEKKTAEVKAMIETYNKQVNFVNYDSLKSIIQYV